ncbi:hypothetical protein [Streptomyces griseosporeus]|uniref:hypothetical protein n=1 Tax=Streptomyces griseosporeus TaxID=1910 RepID=UPI003674CD6A
MDLDTLRFGRFGTLDTAIEDWSKVVKHLETLEKQARDGLKGAAEKANWAGVNASVTREFITKTAGEFTDAHTEASSIHNILKDTRDELVGYRNELNEAISEGLKKNLTVRDTGNGSFVVTMNVHPDRVAEGTSVPDHSPQDAENLKTKVERIMKAAAESETTASDALKALVDQAVYGFSGASYANRDDAAEAMAAAEKLAAMAKKPAGMSPDDIAAFNRAMEKYHDDPLFAEQFAKRLGAKGTLQFWTEMTYTHAGARGSELQSMKDLQSSLRLTLATASFSDSDAMKQWKSDLIAESNTNFRASASTYPVGALGSQVISSLLRQGTFDTEFLDDYRRKLFKADRGAGESNTDDLWVKGYDNVDLVFGDGNGRDPLEGLFEGLSRNPEAASHAFQSKADLNHMLGSARYTDRGESLGRALQSAVTGVAVGDYTSPAPPHSAAQVEIMANVMNAVAQPDGGAELVSHGLGDAFGNMTAAYMPEISRAFAGANGVVFLTNSEKPQGLETADVTRFLSALSLDPAGRAGIIVGESVYTSGLLDAHLSDPSLFDGSREQVLSDIGRNAGIIEGIVAHSIADNDVQQYVDGETEYNAALHKQGDFVKTWLSTGVGYGSVSLFPDTPAGAATGAAVGGFAGGVIGMAVDRLLEGQELKGARDEALYATAKDLYATRHSVSDQTQQSVTDALERHHVNLPKDGASDIVRVAVNDGWDDASELLTNSKERPSG